MNKSSLYFPLKQARAKIFTVACGRPSFKREPESLPELNFLTIFYLRIVDWKSFFTTVFVVSPTHPELGIILALAWFYPWSVWSCLLWWCCSCASPSRRRGWWRSACSRQPLPSTGLTGAVGRTTGSCWPALLYRNQTATAEKQSSCTSSQIKNIFIVIKNSELITENKINNTEFSHKTICRSARKSS